MFARGQPEVFGVSVDAAPAIDMIEFLWASLAQFDDDDPCDTTTLFRPVPLPLHTVAQARDRILQRLSDTPDGTQLAQLLPNEVLDSDAPHRVLRQRSGWATTLVAGLELAKQGTVAMGQGGDFEPIHVAPA